MYNDDYFDEDRESIAAAEAEACRIEGEMEEAVRPMAIMSQEAVMGDEDPAVVYLGDEEFFVEFLGDDHIRAECMTADAGLEARTTVHDLNGMGLFEIALALERQARALRQD